MRTFGVLLLLAAAAASVAQEKPVEPRKPASPARVEKALRARATSFYQAHLDGKYRQAEQYVSDDTKEFFYASQKPRYLKFEISKISYSDKFTKATVVTKVEREVMSQVGKMTFNVPEESHWKLERGRWCWYTDQRAAPTPFGTMQRDPAAAGQPGSGAPLIMKPQVSSMQDLWKLVSANKKEVRLPLAGGSADVVVRNLMKGVVTIKVQAPETPGLQVTADRERIGANYSARVTFKYQPPTGAQAPEPVTVNIQVQPTNDLIPIRVQFEGSTAGK